MAVTLKIPSETAPIVQNALERELGILKMSMDNTEKKLKYLENRYKMDSKQFYERFDRGEMGDSQEIMLWAAEYEALQRVKEEYQRLQNVLHGWRAYQNTLRKSREN
jgi:hypothetical protein